jgi:formylglycine-generating enzyme required for sulfatase activity
MVVIPSGTLHPAGLPPRPVAAFLLGQSEVTFDQWAACVTDGACRGGQDDHGWGRGKRPIINITFADVHAYLAWLSAKTGRTYRLPSEDEWEWAARGGTESEYWWGSTVGEGHANCRHCGTPWGGAMSAPVGSLPANPYGLFDTAGNVWEWTATCWSKKREAPPPKTCREQVIKGGAWYYIPQQSRPVARARQSATSWSYTVGLRVAASLP